MEVNSAEYTETTPGNTITPGSKILKNLTYNSEIRNLTYNSELRNTITYGSEVKNTTGELKLNKTNSQTSGSFKNRGVEALKKETSKQ